MEKALHPNLVLYGKIATLMMAYKDHGIAVIEQEIKKVTFTILGRVFVVRYNEGVPSEDLPGHFFCEENIKGVMQSGNDETLKIEAYFNDQIRFYELF